MKQSRVNLTQSIDSKLSELLAFLQYSFGMAHAIGIVIIGWLVGGSRERDETRD